MDQSPEESKMKDAGDPDYVHIDPNQEEPKLNDDQVLDYTQTIRRRYVQAATAGGYRMPQDPKEAKVLLSALADMDRQSLTKKRLQTDAAATEATAAAIDGMARQVAASIANMGVVMGAVATTPVPRAAPVLDDTGMGPLHTVDGETAVGIGAETYETFENRTTGTPIKGE